MTVRASFAFALSLSLSLLTPLALTGPVLGGGAIEPTGIYYNAFNGSFSGTEWFQLIEIPGTNRYQMADIFGGGFSCTVTSTGSITLDGGVGTGSFSTPDDFVVTPNLGGSVFTFQNNRVPFTTPAFPLELDSAELGNVRLSGAWSSLTEGYDPQTGALMSSGVEELDIVVSGTTFRITDPNGLFFQGVFERANQAVFRVVVPTPSSTRYRTFPGSAINFTRNMLGEAVMSDLNNFTATILLQSRTPLGSQTQLLFRFTAERIDPICVSDIDDDGSVGFSDLSGLLALWGPCPGCAADTNLDGVVGFADLSALLSAFGPCP